MRILMDNTTLFFPIEHKKDSIVLNELKNEIIGLIALNDQLNEN